MVFLAAASLLPGQQNYQKTYPLRSPEYEALRTLYIEQGIALPFATGPFSEAELRHAMDRLDTARLSEAGRTTFDWLRERFEVEGGYREEEGRFRFEAGAEFSLETYLHTDSDNPYWEYRWEDREPFARFPLEAWVMDHGYGIMDFSFMKNIPDFSIYPTYQRSGQYGFDENGDFEYSTDEENPWSNLPTIPSTIDVQFPHRAFISVGGERWNAQIGRDIIDWGNGRTGNLYISDYTDWHDALQLSTFWDRFKFSWIWVSLDGSLTGEEREFETHLVGWDTDGDGRVDTYTDPGDPDFVDLDPTVADRQIYAYEADEEHKNLIAHRFELRLWNRLGLSYTEGIIFGRERIELRHLNPVYHYHSLYTNTQNVGNSHRSFEFDLALTAGLNLYGALTPDQWSSPLEPGTSTQEEPNAVAYLLGLDWRRPRGRGYLSGTLELVYITPWMYIHNSPLTSITNRRYVMAEHGDDRTQIWIDRPLGHYGGNDYALIWLDLSYHEVGRHRYGLTTYYEGDGSVPINALLESTVSDGLRDSLSEEEAELTAPSDGYDGRAVQWRTAATLYGEVWPRLFDGFNGDPGGRTLRVGSQLSAQWMKNRYNRVGDWEFDVQWVVSTTIGF